MKPSWCRAALGAALALACLSARGETEPRPAVTVVPAAGRSGLRVEGIRGSVSIRGGEADELSYTCVLSRNRKRSVPLSLSEDRGWFVVGPGRPRGAAKRRVEIVVPRGFHLEIRAADSRVSVIGLGGDVVLRGAGTEAAVHDIGGSVDVEIEGGRTRIGTIAGDLDVRSVDAVIGVRDLKGSLFSDLRGGSAVIEEVGGAAEVDVDRSILEGRGFAEALRLRARATRVTLDRLERGGHLDVDGGSMEVTGSAGDLTITTNAAVTLRDNHAAIHVDGYGAPVSVIRNDGLTEIKTDGVPVSLEAITGPVRVQGDDLDLRLDDIRGELMVFASESRIEASEAGGSVTIENERGDVSIANARDEVTVRNLDGDVNLTGMAGSVWVEADGSQVVVEWVSLNHAEDSFVGNESGDVSIFFPVRGGCSFEGTTRFGRIESDLAGVELSNDDRSGSGGVNGGEGPAIRVESDGDILLRMAERSEVPQRKGPLRRSESRRDPARQ